MKIIPHNILKSFSYSNFELMFNFKNYFTLVAFYDVISYTFIYITLEISPEYSLEGLMLSWNSNPLATRCEELTHWKSPDAGKDERQEEKGTTEDEMAGWHHRLNGHGFGWTLGVGDGQGGLVCCGSWGLKESDTTERLNWLTNSNSSDGILMTPAKSLHLCYILWFFQ